MKTLEYTGLKQDGERAFKELTGIEWMPGSVHVVKPEHAELMLKHPTIWREVEGASAPAGALATAASAAVVPTGPDPASTLPAWVKKGVEVGLTDEQLEAIAQAGGPQAEAGAALWKQGTGADWVEETKPDVVVTKAAVKTAAKKVAAKKTAKPGAKKAKAE